MSSSKAKLYALASFAAVALTASGSLAALGTQGRVAVPGQVLQRKGTLIAPHRTPAPVTGTEVINALDIDAGDVVSVSFGTSDSAGLAVFDTAVGSFPSEGGSYFVMSTGNTSSALTPNTDPDTSTILDGLDNSQGNDLVQTQFVLTPPPGATCVAFDFAFYSEEFPEFVGSQYNDAFIAEIGQSTFQIIANQVIAPNNFAFDTAGNVISVNTTFGVTAGNATGTTYDGATPFLTAVSPLDNPGSNITITMSIMDLGDSIYDSTVFIDNLRWFFALSCTPGADADSDGDALLDDWEINGIDFDNDGVIDLDLPAMGADPMHKDIFIEIDYMVLEGATGHTHKPKADALQIVIDTFANSPMTNPDGTTGVNIHIDAGADTIMNPVTNETWGTRSRSDALTHQTSLGTMSGFNYNWAGFDAIKGLGMAGSFDIQRADVFHYCIFAHNLAAALGSTSGISRGIPGSDFIVSLGGWTNSVGTTNEQAGTLIHELGHNLDLKHGGNDHGNYKPNYISVMNYFFQVRGLRFNGADGVFDYSRFQLPALDEAALNEPAGLSGVPAAANYGTRFFDPGGTQRLVNDFNGPVDWNQDGDALDNPTSVNLNNTGVCTTGGDFCVPTGAPCDPGEGPCVPTLTVLGNSNNWAEVKFDGGGVGHLGEMIVLPSESEPMDIDQPTDSLLQTDVKVSIAGPGNSTLAACAESSFDVTISNHGDFDDMYVISVSAVQTWADTSGLPGVLALDSGTSATFTIPVLIPEGTPDGSVDVLTIGVLSMANPLIMDEVTTITTAFSADTDGDGLTDDCDSCPTSDLNATIVIDGCDSYVPNTLFEDGCTMSDLIGQCQAAADNHGEFVRCVAWLTDDWRRNGLISGAQKGAIMRCAAMAFR